MWFFNLISFKLTAINHSANSLNCNKHFILVNRLNNWKHVIPRWFEHRTYSYQKYTLPIKLRNPFLYTRALRLELRIWSLKLPILPIKLYSFFVWSPPSIPLQTMLNTVLMLTPRTIFLLSSARRVTCKTNLRYRRAFCRTIISSLIRKRDDLNIQVLKHNI